MTAERGGTFEAPPAAALIAAHARLIAIHGGPGGIRDPGALDAALARPLQLQAHGSGPITLAGFAVAIAHGICGLHHPFADGNKRVAFAALVGILDMNGLALDVAETHAAEAMTAVASGAMPEEGLVAWVALNTYPIDGAKRPPAVAVAPCDAPPATDRWRRSGGRSPPPP